MTDLFSQHRPPVEEIYPQVFVLANFASSTALLPVVDQIARQAPFRYMMTPMGHYTGIELTNCGDLGWHSDKQGYRYLSQDPATGLAWPKIPEAFFELGQSAASEAGYHNFEPDACLINRYKIGDKLGAHQDKNEKDFNWPIVSVSLGLTAEFQIFGNSRSGKLLDYQLFDGDVMVWGGNSRLIYHGVKTVKADRQNPQLNFRINITLRKAG